MILLFYAVIINIYNEAVGGINMDKDYNKIFESDEKMNLSTSYTVKLSEKEINALEKCKNNFSNLFSKQKKANSTIIKNIIENTYLYLNNSERFFNNDVKELLNKKYFKDLDYHFINDLKEGTREYEFILELVRNQVLRIYSKREVDELYPVQFRLAKDDENLLRIISGNKCLSLDEFISGYLLYFLSLPQETQKYILTYPKGIKLDNAIRDKKCIIIGNMKYKPIKFVNKGVYRRKVLLCFDAVFDSLVDIPFVLDKEIIFTEELFNINNYENEVLNSYDNLDYIDISFKLLNNDNKDINKLIDDNMKSEFIIKRAHEYPLEKIRIKYNEFLIENILKQDKKHIDYIRFSDNYNKFIKLTENNKKEYKKYIKELNKW